MKTPQEKSREIVNRCRINEWPDDTPMQEIAVNQLLYLIAQALTLPEVTSEEILDSWKSEWEAVPSQDNEGFVPDRGGFQVGFYCGAQWMQKKLKGE